MLTQTNEWGEECQDEVEDVGFAIHKTTRKNTDAELKTTAGIQVRAGLGWWE